MHETRINDLLQKIAASNLRDVGWRGPATDNDVNDIESALQCRLPRSFREFLLLTGGGGLPGFEVSGVGSSDAAGSVVCDTTVWREEYALPAHLAVIQRNFDDNEPFCLDTSAFQSEECPVVLFYPHRAHAQTELIASDFLTWYANYLAPRLGDD